MSIPQVICKTCFVLLQDPGDEAMEDSAEKTSLLKDLAVVKRQVKTKHGKYYGLLVQQSFAEQFISNNKTLEIRTRPIRFLEANDCVLLVASGTSSGRVALCTLKFGGCLRIPLERLPSYQGLHRLRDDQLKEFCSMASSKGMDCLWGWQLHCETVFSQPLKVPTTSAEVWLLVSEDDLLQALWAEYVSHEINGCLFHNPLMR